MTKYIIYFADDEGRFIGSEIFTLEKDETLGEAIASRVYREQWWCMKYATVVKSLGDNIIDTNDVCPDDCIHDVTDKCCECRRMAIHEMVYGDSTFLPDFYTKENE